MKGRYDFAQNGGGGAQVKGEGNAGSLFQARPGVGLRRAGEYLVED